MAVTIQQITDFLREHKVLSIEKVGTISINNPVEANEEGEQLGSTRFVFDKRAVTSEELYTYIAELQQKNKNIVHSDVDSFFEESRQLMNIGSRPMHFQGIGYIYNDRNTGYNFSETSPLGFKESIPESVNEDFSLSKVPSYNRHNYNKGNGVKVLLIIIILALLAGIGYFVYSLIKENKLLANNEQAIASETVVQPDSLATANAVTAPVANNSEKKFIFETTSNSQRVSRRKTQLENMGKTIYVDSAIVNGQNQYKMYVKIPVENLTDTTRIKDSLFTFFGRRVTIE